MTDEATNKIIELLLTDSTAGLKAYAALTAEEKEQVLEKAQDERINQIVAEPMPRALRIRPALFNAYACCA